jgi:predicted short-subunit dehydrogenase-like oxidoreductase (DUF2520 family)
MKISFIGSGNVATHLAVLFRKAGHTITSVYSHHPAHARTLARKVRAKAAKDISDTLDSDCLVLAVKDDLIPALLKKLPVSSCLVVHTSGTEPLALLRAKFRNRGVLYPVQTFSKNSPAPRKVPFCIEASNTASLSVLRKLARSVSPEVQVMNSPKRKQVHLAAVFANNFSNHLMAIAEVLLKRQHLSLDLLRPLLEETVAKTRKQSPARIQTGPAARGDVQTLREHLHLLKKDKRFTAIYKALSDSILHF